MSNAPPSCASSAGRDQALTWMREQGLITELCDMQYDVQNGAVIVEGYAYTDMETVCR